MVDTLVEYGSFFVNQIRSSVRYIVTFHYNRVGLFVVVLLHNIQNTQSSCQVSVAVGNKGVGYTFDATIVLFSAQPSEMYFGGITRSSNNNGISLFQLTYVLLKGKKLRRTNKSEIFWVPEQQNFFVFGFGFL